MPVRTISCVVVDCDGCGDGWESEDGRWHYGTEEEARLALTGDLEWEVTATGAWLCRSCTVRRACKELGHEFGSWWACRCQGRILWPGHGDPDCVWQVRMCDRCGGSEQQRADKHVVAAPGSGGER